MLTAIVDTAQYNYSGRRTKTENKIIKTKEGKLPKEFDPANLTNLFVDQFVTWDEVYRKVIPGSNYIYLCNRYKDHIMKFPRKKNGKLEQEQFEV